jgi:hypothetical protein
MAYKLTVAQSEIIKKVIVMTNSCNDENEKSEFLNRVVDITSKINVAVDNLMTMTGSNIRNFSEDEARNIRNAINDITSAASLILTDSVSIIAPEELEKVKQSFSFSTAYQQTDESHERYDDDILNNLPDAAAADIVRLIGINQAMKLFKAFGGSTFPIGKGIRYLGGARAKALRSILNEEEIQILMDYFQGDIVYLLDAISPLTWIEILNLIGSAKCAGREHPH